MRITFVIAGLGIGGAERILALVANGLRSRGHDITILTFAQADVTPSQPLDPAVRLEQLDLARPARTAIKALANNLERLRTLRRAIRKSTPDVVVPFMDTTNVLTLLALAGSGIPVVACERTDPARHRIGRAWNLLRNLTYPMAARVTLQTSGTAGAFPERIRRRCSVLPNPVAIDSSGVQEAEITRPAIIGVGRLSREKGFDVLLRAYSLARAELPPGTGLWILGEGAERPNLETLRGELGLGGAARLPGAVSRPGPCLAGADLFVLPSRFEGFPVALCEAMACGLPVICTEFSSGMADIVTPGENALVVPCDDPEAMAAAMRRLLADETLRSRLGRTAAASMERFSLRHILDRWEALLNECLR
ncbi:MAG: glycosyltransferase family 4 protein [Desulfovibrionaceae bacterium]